MIVMMSGITIMNVETELALEKLNVTAYAKAGVVMMYSMNCLTFAFAMSNCFFVS